EIRVDAISSAAMHDHGGAIRAGYSEPPSLEHDPVAAVEGHIVVCRGDRARGWIERHALYLGDRFRDPEGDGEIRDERRGDDRHQEIGQSFPRLSRHATNVSPRSNARAHPALNVRPI